MFLRPLLSFTVLISSFHLFAAQTKKLDCTVYSKNEEIRGCLNEYAKDQLKSGSRAEESFRNKFSRVLRKYNLELDQVKYTPLDQMFAIIVEQYTQLDRNDKNELCYDFEDMTFRKTQIKGLQKQIDEVALFLADFHSKSFGRQVSVLFPIKEVSLCSESLVSDRPSSFFQRSLIIGTDDDGREIDVIKSNDIMERWQSGDPIRRTDLTALSQIPLVGPFGRKVKQVLWDHDPGAVLRDKLAEKWDMLNPTSTPRSTAIYTLAELLYSDNLDEIKNALTGHASKGKSVATMAFELDQIISGPGFSSKNRERWERLKQNDEDVKSLYGLYKHRLYSPQTIVHVFESGVAESIQRGGKFHAVLRNIKAGINVSNDKNIAVELESMMKAAVPVSQFDDDGGMGATELTVRNPIETSEGEIVYQELNVRGSNLQDYHV
ncbi:MAG: hypothetical protein KDD48_08995, partial [Bdellovibrionales bacterium]|nr:hypothetical protein [Bdellovibrionales bacterium]